MSSVEFEGEIKVASRIIDYLSSGLYKDPASCLKELVNNSYDANAKNVYILVKPDADRIIIEDDGIGMNRLEFEKHFKRISESHKRDDSDVTSSGRKKIGKIGIGFIAANEICDAMEIFSTKKGSAELLHVTVNFSEMRKPPEQREESSGDVKKADYTGEILEVDKREHYTQIFLNNVRGEAREILAGAKPQKENDKLRSLYGLKPESISRILESPNITEWKMFDSYSETMLKIALNVPLQYHDNWIPKKYLKTLQEFEDETYELDFRVFYDGTELRKPIVFAPENKRAFVEKFEYNGNKVSARGYFYVQHGTLKPLNLHGLLLRIRHSAVGDYDHQFFEFPTSEMPLIQRWISAEIWADDRLEDAMNIDRRTLRDTHPAYVEFRSAIHKKLREVLRRALKDLYEAGSGVRKAENTQKMSAKLAEVVKSSLKEQAPDTAKEIRSAFVTRKQTRDSQKILLKKYSVAELYEIVIDAAKETLTPTQMAKFISALTKRLKK